MKIQSMTGYGSGVAGNFRFEARSLNHRFLDVQVKIPSYLYFYEPEIRKLVKKRFQRGRIEILASKLEGKTAKLKINKSFAKELYNGLNSLKDELSIPGNVGIDVLASQRDIFSLEEPKIEITTFRNALNIALKELEKMRVAEGSNLVKDINRRRQTLEKQVNHIKSKRKKFIAASKTLLLEKLKDLLGNKSIDDARLVQEAAILIEKTDITEEIVRIKSHLSYMENTLKSGDSVGRKMDFLAQELHRELNTISSKTSNIEISTLVIEMKNELEKIREQVQNLQ